MSREAYTHSFARIYDEIMSGVPYDLWYDYLQELLSLYKCVPEKVLDLACGTGNMSLRFARDDKQVVGIDRSREMLTVARRKALSTGENIKFFCSDLRDFRLEENFDFVFSVFDSMNYLLSITDLRKVFSNVFRVLKKNGVFVFDFNTIQRLMSIEPGTTIFTGEDYSCFWEDRVNQEQQRWIVELQIEFDTEEELFEETHQETAYPLVKVEQMLNKSGFTGVDIFRAYTFKKASETDNRVYFVAYREEDPDISSFSKITREVKWSLRRLLNYKNTI